MPQTTVLVHFSVMGRSTSTGIAHFGRTEHQSGGFFKTDRHIQKQTEANWKQTEAGRNTQKPIETNKHRQKHTETNRNKQKHIETDSNKQNHTETHGNTQKQT